MVILGLLLLVLGWLLGIGALLWLGVILLLVGLVLGAIAFAGHGRYYY